MKILFVLYFDITESSQIGVTKKIRYQVDAMRYLNHDVDVAYCREGKFIVESENSGNKEYEAPCGRTHYRKSILKVLNQISPEYDMIYIRFPGSIDYYLYKTFSMIRDKGTKVVLEMPTYPIGGEMIDILKTLLNQHKYVQVIKRGIVYGIHKVLSRRISKKVTCIVSYSDYEYIWGTKVINIENGINCEDVVKKQITKNERNEIHLLFVAVFAIWHGLDRVIKGLDQYYKTKKDDEPEIELTLVGESEELERIINSEEFLSVKEHIRVLGKKYGHELDKEYDRADIAISSLGMHRIGLTQGSTLKTREYCAKGIPFIYGYRERGITESFPYALRVAADESPVNIHDVISFYNHIKDRDYINEMHEFSKKYDWKTQMRIFFEGLQLIEG